MGRILIRGEDGDDIIPALYPVDGETVIDKPGKGAFYNTNLGELLQQKGIANLLVTGVTTEGASTQRYAKQTIAAIAASCWATAALRIFRNSTRWVCA